METSGNVYYLVEQGLVDRWTVVRVPLATVVFFATLLLAEVAGLRLLPNVSWANGLTSFGSVALAAYVGYQALALIPAAGTRATLELSREWLVLTEKNGAQHSLSNAGWTKLSEGLAHQKARNAQGEVYRLPGLVDRVESLGERPYKPIQRSLRVVLRDGMFFVGEGGYDPTQVGGTFTVLPFE